MKKYIKSATVLTAASLLFMACGCATADRLAANAAIDRSGPWTPSDMENALGGPDPIEGFNRSMFAVNVFLFDYVADPLGRVYTSILPRPGIEALDRVCVNLEYPGRAVSCLLRAEWRGAGDETVRFLTNTTIGVAGIFDVAKHWGFFSTGSNFGQTFAAWGIGPGCTLVLPMMSQLNVRDTCGALFDLAFDCKTYIPYAGWATALNRMVVAHRSFIHVVEGSSDKYKTYRELALLNREMQQRMLVYRAANRAYELYKAREAAAKAARPTGKSAETPTPPREPEVLVPPAGLAGRWVPIPGYRSRGAVLDSLRVLRFTPRDNDDKWYFRLSIFNRDFTKRCDVRKLEITPDAPALHYGFWAAPGSAGDENPRPEKLALLLPGIGGNYFGVTATALAELMNRHHFAVASLDSVFAWQFAAAFGNRRLPGYLPEDAADLRTALGAVLGDLKKRGDIQNPEISLIGYSFGGLHTLKLAELEGENPTLGIRRYIAINPPVDLKHAVEVADRLSGASRTWSLPETIDRAVDAAGRQLATLTAPMEPFDPERPNTLNYAIDIDRAEAECFSGLYLKTALRSLLFTAARSRGIGLNSPYSWGDRNRLYLEIDRIGAVDYAARFVAAEHPDISLDELYRASDLRTFGTALRGRGDITVLHNVDDYLLTPDARQFLGTVFGSRLVWFSNGGHLGNLYVTTVQRNIVAAAEGRKP